MCSLRATTHAPVFSIGLGVGIGLVSSLIQSLGLTLQRKSHVLNQLLPSSQQKPEYRRPLWLLGLLVFLASNLIGSLVQIASLPVVILAPLGAISLLWNALFARLLLGDVFSKRLVIGTILITGGAVLIAFFGIVPDSEKERDLEELMRLWRRPPFIGWFSTECFVVFVWLVITHITEFSYNRRLRNDAAVAAVPTPLPSALPSPVGPSAHPTTLTTTVADTLSSSLPSEQTPLLHLDSSTKPKSYSEASSIASSVISTPSPSRISLFISLSYASLSGIISGACLLLAKSGVWLLLLTIGGDNQFKSAGAWLIIFGLVLCALAQMWYLHKALILAGPTIVCPSAFCFYNVSSILNGLIYFDQFRFMSSLYLGLVSLGTVILLAGVWIVSVQPNGKGVAMDGWESDSATVSDVDITAEEANESGSEGTTEDAAPHEYSENPLEHWPQLPVESGAERLSASYDTHRRPSMTINTTIPHHHRRYSTTPLSPTGVGLGGFQIGISAVSPGFAIKPEQRGTRRRLSSLQAEEGVHTAIRRTVSEGSPTQAGGTESRHEPSPPTEHPKAKPASKRRWFWFKRRGHDV